MGTSYFFVKVTGKVTSYFFIVTSKALVNMNLCCFPVILRLRKAAPTSPLASGSSSAWPGPYCARPGS